LPVFLRIQHRHSPQKPPSGCWRNTGYWRIGHHFRRTITHSTLLTKRFLQAKVQATPRTNLTSLRLSTAPEFDRRAVVYIRKTCRSFCPYR
jgi:hypothetical protein